MDPRSPTLQVDSSSMASPGKPPENVLPGKVEQLTLKIIRPISPSFPLRTFPILNSQGNPSATFSWWGHLIQNTKKRKINECPHLIYLYQKGQLCENQRDSSYSFLSVAVEGTPGTELPRMNRWAQSSFLVNAFLKKWPWETHEEESWRSNELSPRNLLRPVFQRPFSQHKS